MYIIVTICAVGSIVYDSIIIWDLEIVRFKGSRTGVDHRNTWYLPVCGGQ